VERQAGGSKALKKEVQWLDRIRPYTDEVSRRAMAYDTGVKARLAQPGDSSILGAYFEALESVVSVPDFCRRTLGTAPTSRTKLITETLERGAEHLSAWGAKWDIYVTGQDEHARTEAIVHEREFLALSNRASVLLKQLAAS
jgi:hypothetical protein